MQTNLSTPHLDAAYRFEVIYLESEVEQYPWVQEMLRRCRGIPVEIVDDIRTIIAAHHHLPYPLDAYGFKRLLVGKNRGVFLKPCPCSEGSVSCRYYFLHIGVGCPLDCSYCFLQGFLDTSFPVLYVNFAELEQELALLAQTGTKARLGTGEMTDSLVFEPITGFARHLIPMFAAWPQLQLELKTKTVMVDDILEMGTPNVVIGWSLNPEKIARLEEQQAVPPTARLQAALKCWQAGFRVAFHFDPIIAYPGWEDEYRQLLRLMLEQVPAEKIAWISLGIFRIFPRLRDIIRSRFPKSELLLHELIPGYDGKLRYFKGERITIYRQMLAWLREFCGDKLPPVYLCMESPEVWAKLANHGLKMP